MLSFLSSRKGSFLVMALLGFHCLSNAAIPRPPLAPWPETPLFSLHFDEPYVEASQKAAAPVVDTSIWIESWSGYALNRQGQVKPVSLPMQATNGYPFIANGTGTIRFWFSPNWTSGNGPGHEAHLLDLVSINQKTAFTWWQLAFSRNGRNLSLNVQSDDGLDTLASVPVNLQASQWHLFTLEYSPTNTYIYIDAQLVATGEGFPIIPDNILDITSLVIGSDFRGRNSAEGQFDEFAAFNNQSSYFAIASYYNAIAPQASLGPILSMAAERARQTTVNQTRLMTLPMVSSDDSDFTIYLAQSGLRLTFPSIPTTNNTVGFLTLLGGDTNKSYDIYFVPALTSTNTPWTFIAAQGTQGQTNFTVSVTNFIGFFRATEGSDWDNDRVPNYMDANPTSTNTGALTITITTPTNGSTVD